MLVAVLIHVKACKKESGIAGMLCPSSDREPPRTFDEGSRDQLRPT